jgi:hypothetical protein
VTGRRFLAVHWDPTLGARGSRRKGGRPGRLDRDRNNADRAATAKLTSCGNAHFVDPQWKENRNAPDADLWPLRRDPL